LHIRFPLNAPVAAAFLIFFLGQSLSPGESKRKRMRPATQPTMVVPSLSLSQASDEGPQSQQDWSSPSVRIIAHEHAHTAHTIAHAPPHARVSCVCGSPPGVVNSSGGAPGQREKR
jgi:hypothetical protein